MTRKHAAALAALVGALGCSGDDSGAAAPTDDVFDVGELPDVVVPVADSGAMPDDGALGSDASSPLDPAMGDAAAPPDAGEADAGVDAAVVEEDLFIVGDVRTNVGHLAFRDMGPDDLKIVSIFIRRVSTPSLESILLHGEYENRGSVQQCIPLLDLRVGGLEMVAVAEGHPRLGDLGGATACLAPGERSVFSGIENDIPPTLVEDAQSVDYAFTALTRDYPPHPATPTLLSAERFDRDGLTGFRGRMLTTSMPIYNMSIDFHAKDARGLIVDDTSAFPQDLETIPTNAVVDYASYSFTYHTGPIIGFIAVMDFLDGVAPSQSASVSPAGSSPLSPEAARLQEARRRRLQMRELRGMLP